MISTNRQTTRIAPFAAAAATLALVAGISGAQSAPGRPSASSSSAAPNALGQTIRASGLTAPSDVRKIGFDVRGVVAKVNVRKNDKVKAGDPLVSLDDAEQVATLTGLKLAADPKLAVAEAEQTYSVKQLEYERKAEVYAKEPNGSTEREMKTAEAEMTIAKIRIEQARHEAAQNQARADAQAAAVARMHKQVPADFGEGQVSDVSVKVGEQIDESRPIVEIVDLDPLYVDVTLVPTEVVQHLKLGQKIMVKYAEESQPREATVDAIDPSADRKSGTHPFRLTLPNPEQRNAGLRVEIELPSPPAIAAGR